MGKVRSSCRKAQSTSKAQVVELVDTIASGASARKGVEVQVLSWAPSTLFHTKKTYIYRPFQQRYFINSHFYHNFYHKKDD